MYDFFTAIKIYLFHFFIHFLQNYDREQRLRRNMTNNDSCQIAGNLLLPIKLYFQKIRLKIAESWSITDRNCPKIIVKNKKW